MAGAVLFKQMGHETLKGPSPVDRFQRPGETKMTKGSNIAPSFDQQRDIQLPIASPLFGQRFCCRPPTLGGVGPTVWHGAVHRSNASNTSVNCRMRISAVIDSNRTVFCREV